MFIYNFFIENFSNAELWGLGTFAFIWFIQFLFYVALFAKPTRYAKRSEKGKLWHSAAKPNVSVIV